MLKVRLAATLLVAAFLSGCVAHETDRTTMAASADNSQLNPLGQADHEEHQRAWLLVWSGGRWRVEATY